MDSGIDDPTDFNNLAFQGLDDHLRCPICKEFFNTAVILATCSHTFCSLCIRRSLSAEEVCPSCRHPAIESKLHNNLVVDYLVGIWKANRKQVLDLEKQSEETSSTRDSPMDTSSQPSANPTSLTPTRVTRSSSRRSASQPSSTETETPADFAAETPAQAVTETISEVELNDNSQVSCPICSRKMEMRHLNQHLDLCMHNKPDPALDRKAMTPTSELQSPKGQLMFRNPQPPANSSPTRVKNVNTGPKPKRIVYNLESQARLKKELRDLGLPDHGDKTALIQRHKTYLSIYSANEDSLNPLDSKALRKKLAEEEEIQSRGAGKKVEDNDIEQHKRKYESEFDSLIRVARERKRQKEMETKQSNESTSKQPITPPVTTPLPSANTYEPLTDEQWKLLEDDSFQS